jgi:hypothetical protein
MITDQEIESRFKFVKFIWFVMLISLGIYLLVGLQIGDTFPVMMPDETLSTIKTVFYIAACVILIAARQLKKFLLNRKVSVNPSADFFETAIFQKYLFATAIFWALSESIGVFGLILYLLGKNTNDLYILMLFSAAAIILTPPKKEDVRDLIEFNRKRI